MGKIDQGSENSAAYRRGWKNVWGGGKITENPYAIGTPEHDNWQKGWTDSREFIDRMSGGSES